MCAQSFKTLSEIRNSIMKCVTGVHNTLFSPLLSWGEMVVHMRLVSGSFLPSYEHRVVECGLDVVG